jgi:hypothetical protein
MIIVMIIMIIMIIIIIMKNNDNNDNDDNNDNMMIPYSNPYYEELFECKTNVRRYKVIYIACNDDDYDYDDYDNDDNDDNDDDNDTQKVHEQASYEHRCQLQCSPSKKVWHVPQS